jgi:protein-disulfide isomerase
MKAPFRSIALLAAAAALTLSACADPSAIGDIKAAVERIEAQQKDVVTKLEAVEKSNKELATKVGSGAAAKPNAPDPNKVHDIKIGNSYSKGPANAAVTIVEWSDFQCPFCNRVNPTMKELQAAYGDDLRIAFKHNALPMHDRAKPAAIAAEAAGKQGKFWEMHDLMFANAKELTDENFVKWAGEIGLDVAIFAKDLEDPALAKKVDAHQKQGMGLGARGTPAFFVNGRYLSGAQPFDKFKALIDEEIEEADRRLATGTSKSGLYDALMATAKDKP